jgi:outer membrane protein
MRAWYLVAGCLAVATTAVAQAPTVLTLERALELARERNPAYLRSLAQADASGASVRAGFGAFLPSLNASVGWNGNRNTTSVGQDDFGRPIIGDSSVTFESSGANQGLSSSVTLFDGFQNVNNYRAAKASADAAGASVDQQAVAVEAEVARRFFSALQARRLISVEEQLLEVSRRQLDATDRLFRVAARTEVDVLGAQVQLAQQEQALEQARGDARRADLLLAETIGLEDQGELELVGTLPAAFDPTALDADSLVQIGFQQSPALARSRADAAQAGFSAGAAKGRYWPTVTANANFSRSQNSRNFDSFFDFNPQDNRGLGIGLNVQIPIFNRFSSRDAVAQAVARSRIADENLREAELQLERGIRSAYIDLVTAFRRLQLAQRAVDLSRRRLTMAQEQYQLGTIGFTDFQQIVTQTSQDARQLITAELEFSRALVTLEESVGGGVRP